VLLAAGRILRGLEVAGFPGALVAAAAIGLLHVLITWVLGTVSHLVG